MQQARGSGRAVLLIGVLEHSTLTQTTPDQDTAQHAMHSENLQLLAHAVHCAWHELDPWLHAFHKAGAENAHNSSRGHCPEQLRRGGGGVPVSEEKSFKLPRPGSTVRCFCHVRGTAAETRGTVREAQLLVEVLLTAEDLMLMVDMILLGCFCDLLTCSSSDNAVLVQAVSVLEVL